MGKLDRPLKLGKISFLNVFPIYYALEKGIVSHPFQIISGTPSQLNRMVSSEELLISAVSSVEYGRHFKHYFLIPDLSISASGKVGSVILFSHYPAIRLDNLPVLLSRKSLSSSLLLKVLFKKRWNAKPYYISGELGNDVLLNTDIAAVLAIGDDALRIMKRKIFPYAVDLGEAWYEWTSKPFVFGVWVINQNIVSTFNGYVERACNCLLKSKDYGLENLRKLSKEAAKLGILSEDECLAYFQLLDYDFTPSDIEGMKLFFGYLVETGVFDENPEIRFCEDSGLI